MTNVLTFDTNLLVYFVDSTDTAKHNIAKRVIETCYYARSPLPLQCLTEFYWAATRKKFLSREAATEIVLQVRTALTVVSPNADDLQEAMRVHRQHNVAFWDAMFYATAQRADCNVLLSEDFQDGRTFGGLTIRNPFKMSEAELDQLLG